MLRRRLRVVRRGDSIDASGGPDIGVLSHQVDVDLVRAPDSLSNKQRAVIALHHMYGYTLDECAPVMGCGRGPVRTHLFRALTSLQGQRVMTDDLETRLVRHFEGMARQPLPPAVEDRMRSGTRREPALRLWLNITVGVATAAALFAILALARVLHDRSQSGGAQNGPSGALGAGQLAASYTDPATGYTWNFLPAGAPCQAAGRTDAGCLLIQGPAEHAASGAWGPVRYFGTQMTFSVVYDTPPQFCVSSCVGTTSSFTISSGGQAGQSVVRLTPAPGSCIASAIELDPPRDPVSRSSR